MSLRCWLSACGVGIALWSPAAVSQQDMLTQNLVRVAQDNFWGRAVLSSGETVQPIDDAERTAAVIPFADSARVVRTAGPVGQAIWCGVEWRPYYLAFMQSERAKSWSEKQIAFIGLLFGLAQRTISTALIQRSPCPAETRENLLRSLSEATKNLDDSRVDAP